MTKILHQLISRLSHYLQGFIHPRWCRISSINRILVSSWICFFWRDGGDWHQRGGAPEASLSAALNVPTSWISVSAVPTRRLRQGMHHKLGWKVVMLPRGSMYGIFTYIYHKNQLNVGIYVPYMDGMGTDDINWVYRYIIIFDCTNKMMQYIKGKKTLRDWTSQMDLWWGRIKGYPPVSWNNYPLKNDDWQLEASFPRKNGTFSGANCLTVEGIVAF